MQQFIAYRRVSREDIGTSAPSLAEQERRISHHVRAEGEVVQWFEEIESGLYDDRPVLAYALEEASLWGVTLIVSDPCRLTMSHGHAAELSRLREDIVVCGHDAKHLQKSLAAHGFAYWQERAMRLGPMLEGSRQEADEELAANVEKMQWSEDTLDFLRRLGGDGMGHDDSAKALNAAGYRTRNGRQFNYQAVYNLRKLGGLL